MRPWKQFALAATRSVPEGFTRCSNITDRLLNLFAFHTLTVFGPLQGVMSVVVSVGSGNRRSVLLVDAGWPVRISP